jgi:hypothetical protein
MIMASSDLLMSSWKPDCAYFSKIFLENMAFAL